MTVGQLRSLEVDAAHRLSPAVQTPILILDRAVLERNVDAMALRANQVGATLWPHAKTHKCAEIAALQLARGSAGVTVATLSEAESLVAAGVRELLVAFPVVGPQALDRLVRLARAARVRVTVDDPQLLLALRAASRRAGVCIPYLWEVDTGAGRLGTPPGQATVAAIEALEPAPETPFDGLLSFPGHAYAARDEAELIAIAAAEREAMAATALGLRAAGIEVRCLSIGSTPTVHHLERLDSSFALELRPGNYVFYDATQVALGVASEADCALSVLTTVVGRPRPDRLILDAGSKALAAERMTPRTKGFGILRGFPQLRVEKLYEQHAIVRSDGPVPLTVGDQVRVIPNHSCAAVNLHPDFVLCDDGELVGAWPIVARGPGN